MDRGNEICLFCLNTSSAPYDLSFFPETKKDKKNQHLESKTYMFQRARYDISDDTKIIEFIKFTETYNIYFRVKYLFEEINKWKDLFNNSGISYFSFVCKKCSYC